MGIVPLEITNREFPKVLRGYDPAQVRAFLEEVASEFGKVMSERSALQSELQAVRDNLAKYHELEDSIKEALLLAQKTREDVVESAKKQADLIVQEAHRQGHKIEERYARVKSAKKEFESEFELLLESFRKRIAEMKERAGADTATENGAD
ncbi:MAG TPA: DivIVA domain-containing protein [bacterium]|nr:DivIVA domain-containing protein [bacterium]